MTEPTLAPPAEPEALGLRVLEHNPFLDNRVSGPSAAEAEARADVGDIHRAAFERLTALAAEAHRARRGLGVVLWGEAGVGKSHVLARLARWAADHACFVYLHNLQADPSQLPRSLLRAVLGVLTRGQQHQLSATPLYDLVFAGVLEAVGGQRRFFSWEYLTRAFAAWVDRLGRDGSAGASAVDHAVFDVLFRFLRSAQRARLRLEEGREAALAVRWLSGQMLAPADARLLGLGPGTGRDDPVGLADVQQVKQVLIALARLAGCKGQPLILAFDQVDNLDEDQMAALARFQEALLDSAPGLLAVTAGVQATLHGWRERVIQQSAWDRLAQFQVQLQRLTPAEAEEVVAARLAAYFASYSGAEGLARAVEQDRLFPLGRAWAERALAPRVHVRPRDVLNWAREAWGEQQERLRAVGVEPWLAGAAAPPPPPPPPELLAQSIDLAVEACLSEHRAERRRTPAAEPFEADDLAELLYQLLHQCLEPRPDGAGSSVERGPTSRAGARLNYDLTLIQQNGGRAVRTGVLVLIARHANMATGALRRLVNAAEPIERRFLVVDRRLGLKLGPRGREYLGELRRTALLGLTQYELGEAEFVELEGLAAAVRQARSGDLEATESGQTHAVTEAEVIASHRRRGRYAACGLLRELLTVPAHAALPPPRSLARDPAQPVTP
jgi:hypothetical protein